MRLKDYEEGKVLLFDKPYKWTSNDLVKKIKFLLRVKIGHCGTLDPLASGLLILCTGKATKQCGIIQSYEKEYTGTFRLGATTPSFDLETDIDRKYDTLHIDEKLIRETAAAYIGEIEQAPPVYSAKKHEGKRYYELARAGEIFEVRKSKVILSAFEITDIRMPEVDFRIVCGKGFYVRSLAYDFGKALNSGAYLSALRRTRIGPYKVDDAWQVDNFVQHIKDLKKEMHAGSSRPE
jgi:tRNA pseudouridine55 synthase